VLPKEKVNEKIKKKREEESAILCARIQDNGRICYTSCYNNSGAPGGAQRIASWPEKILRGPHVIRAYFKARWLTCVTPYFHINKIFLLSTHCVSLICMDVTTNSHWFPIQD